MGKPYPYVHPYACSTGQHGGCTHAVGYRYAGCVRNARWDEVDLEGAVWIIPAARMKAGKEHRVPLSSPALAMLNALHDLRINEFVFPGAKPSKPLSQMALEMVLRRMQRDKVTVHGFRSAFRDWAAECTSFPNEVCEAALAHTVADKTEAAYRRGDLFDKRRKLMDAWAAHCTAPKGATVVPFQRQA